MKTLRIFIVLLFALGGVFTTSAQTFDLLWQQVRQAEKQSLPKTVIELTDRIYRKAETEKNSPQMLKAYTWRTKYCNKLTPDSFYVNLQELEQWAKRAEKPMDRAILNSLIAGFYTDYANNNKWALRSRKEIAGETPPADLRQWTGNMFVDKVIYHTKEALKDSLLLLTASARDYVPFIKLGDGGEYYRHDMFHLLTLRAIEAFISLGEMMGDGQADEWVERLFRQAAETYQKREEREAYLLIKLDWLAWEKELKGKYRSWRYTKREDLEQVPYIIELNRLIDAYQSQPIAAHIYLRKVNYAMAANQRVAALKLCDEAIRLFPKFAQINAFRNIRMDILSTRIYATLEEAAYPGDSLEVKVNYQNRSEFRMRIYKGNQLVSEPRFQWTQPVDYCEHDTVFKFKVPGVGKYSVCIVGDGSGVEKEKKKLLVSRIQVIAFPTGPDTFEIMTVDRRTGHPIPNVNVRLFASYYEVVKELTTGADGRVVFKSDKAVYSADAYKAGDNAMPRQHISCYNFIFIRSTAGVEKLLLLTDRGIYRPGQTVYVKGIAYQSKADTANVEAYRNVKLEFLSPKREVISTKTVLTNSFGSFAEKLVLPSECVNGEYYVRSGNETISFRIEEYKRPTFDITFDKQTASYQLDEKIQMKGKVQTFSGVPVQNRLLSYSVKRSVCRWWRMNESKDIASGEATVGEDGTFSFPVTLESDSKEDDPDLYYLFTVTATVTNQEGETQSSTDMIFVGKRSLQLSVGGMESLTCKDRPVPLEYVAKNLNGEPVALQGTYQLYRSEAPDHEELTGEPVLSGTFVSNQKVDADWKNLPSGQYQLLLKAQDTQGRPVSFRARTVLFSTADTRPPVKSDVWCYEENTDFDETCPAVFYYGTSKKDTYVMMRVYNADRVIENRVFENLTDTIVKMEIPYRESYGSKVGISLSFVKDGKLYERRIVLNKRLPEKKLTMKWDVFRDKLRPGAKEEWKLTIRDSKGKPAYAEMLAMMYDASLDKLWKNRQYFGVYDSYLLPSPSWKFGRAGSIYFNDSRTPDFLSVPEWTCDRFVLPYEYRSGLTFTEAVVGKKYKVKGKGTFIQFTAPVLGYSSQYENAGEDIAVADLKVVVADVGYSSGQEEELPKPTEDLRTNFSETAFFYPHLMTNPDGEISFSFTMPHSLTRWNFRGYSHTQDMLLGTLDAEVTTSKEFMLSPNLPRFVRVGDETSIAAAIINMTGKVRKGTARFVLFDPATDEVIDTITKDFSVDGGQTTGVNFTFTATGQYDVLGCRIIAETGTFSDGEQQLLPVLSDKIHLVETVSMPMRGEQTRTFSLDELFNRRNRTATNRSLTVEYTGNPAWYAIQALPSLGQPAGNDAISQAAAYYANELASHIANSQPRIKAVFESWKLQGGNKETFMSNLQKNEEVKNILLAESPWVMEARTEQQQKERIATLFDLNNTRESTRHALAKLQELQNAQGAWSWYKGMEGSRYLTSYIVELTARVAMLTGKQPEGAIQKMQNHALGYLHEQALEEYQYLLKAQANGSKSTGLSDEALRYLYLIAITGTKVPATCEQAYTYFISKASGLLTDQSMGRKALAAIVLDKAGRKQESQAFLKSLKEHLTRTDEQGMFFDFNESPYSIYGFRIPVHVAVMEALSIAPDNASAVEEMKLWLLKQKQTQQWNSPISTVNAVFALLMRGSDLLENRGDVRITLADQVIETRSQDAASVPGLGYVARSFEEEAVVNARQVTVEKKDAGIAWGAVYARFDSPMSDVKQQGGELNVKKQLYVERTSGGKTELRPITGKTVLNVGDKVVSRLTIRLDRAMDFVQLKDPYSACFEPVLSLSGYRRESGIGYYADVKDASTNFFFDSLGKGVYVLDNSYHVSRCGTYEGGIATIQCAYAPEFAAHSGSGKVVVAE